MHVCLSLDTRCGKTKYMPIDVNNLQAYQAEVVRPVLIIPLQTTEGGGNMNSERIGDNTHFYSFLF